MRRATIDEVITSVGRTHRDLVLDRNDVAAWCLEVLEENGAYEVFEEHIGVAIAVTHGRAMLPLNIYRLMRVGDCSACPSVKYQMKPGFVEVPIGTKVVYVDMLTFEVDENGEPMIDDSMVKPCHTYCVMKKLIEPYYKGDIRKDVFDHAQMEYLNACARARSSVRNIDPARMRRVGEIMRSHVVMPRSTRY